jgi:hypothetical protein
MSPSLLSLDQCPRIARDVKNLVRPFFVHHEPVQLVAALSLNSIPTLQYSGVKKGFNLKTLYQFRSDGEVVTLNYKTRDSYKRIRLEVF